MGVRVVIADGAYDRAGLLAWLLGQWEVGLECVGRLGVVVLWCCCVGWLVERSFAWLLLGYGMPYPYLFVLVLGCVVWWKEAWMWLVGIRRLMRYIARNGS